MNLLRRSFLNRLGALGALAAGVVFGLLRAGNTLAAEWNKTAFDSATLAEALKSMAGVGATESKDILIKAPDHAENGASVQMEIVSNIPGTTSFAILIEKNPRPLLADIAFSNGAESYAFLRAKFAETSRIRVLARAGGKTYFATKEVGITTSGC